MRFDSGWTPRLLIFMLSSVLPTAACFDTGAAAETVPDAGPLRGEDPSSPPREDGEERGDAAAVGCPASEPSYGTACSGGALRCPLRSHADCVAPSCPPGCKYLGIAPGAQLTSGVAYFAVCQDGIWTRASEGSCSTNKDAALCECGDQDAGNTQTCHGRSP
jgi:hypothetical protein